MGAAFAAAFAGAVGRGADGARELANLLGGEAEGQDLFAVPGAAGQGGVGRAARLLEGAGLGAAPPCPATSPAPRHIRIQAVTCDAEVICPQADVILNDTE